MMMNWKGFDKKRPWPNFKVLSGHLPGGTEQNLKNLNQYSWSPGRESNPGHLEYEVGELTTQSQRSV
jgi:hypothetical protein